ncbi:DUF4185 domain-containing protein [Dyadobacter jiangsuensis]|uniref:Uncharacterized protein DUF4185 n=1 Tax=Dyadobacter jiangsuensis TaxID=1591085 RepID=A0A2P8FZQ7_9BACT|nr:DUF4185 domain-containing protein [Dyadobacter jiangsuensis]PSL27198.1 uncharacterized protein DUF4185 [Dyadobacter jiangsuensis]
MRNTTLTLGIILTCLAYASGQVRNGVNGLNVNEFTASPAPEWSDLFLRKSGWLGGDGIFAIPFSGRDAQKEDSILFLFSDTVLGEIDGAALKSGFSLVNNSVALLRGKSPDTGKITFRIAGEGKGHRAVFIPKSDKPDKDTYFWLGDGFVNPDAGKDLFIFAYQITNTHDNSAFPFKETGNSVIRIPAGSHFPYTGQEQFALPFNDYQAGGETISFGAGIYNNSRAAGEASPDGFVYIYGTKGPTKKLVAARVKPDRLTLFDQWEFRGKRGWTQNASEAAALSDSVSNELSVSMLAPGKYALVYQLGSIFPEICMQVGPTPYGPFGPRIVLYKTSADIRDPDLFTYNAKAHPALSAPGELLISYNVNTFKFLEVLPKQPNLYRPHFVRIQFSQSSKSK